MFLKVQTNEEIQKYADNTLLLDNTIISMNFLEKYPELEKLKIKESKLKSLKKKLNKENIRENGLTLSTIELKTLITQPIDVETIQDKIRLLNSYKKNMSEISSVLQDINATRDTLLTHFNNMNHLIGNQQQECPLCGNDWDSYTELIKNIQIKSKTFQKHYDSSTRQYEVELTILFKDHLDPIITWIDQYLNEPNNIIDEEFFNQLTKSIKESNSVIKFAEWCQQHEIELLPFLNQDISVVEELEYKREKLQELLLTKKYTIENSYTEHEEKKNTYIRIFNSNHEEVRNLKLTQIEDKAKYIEYQYYHRSSKNIDILHKEIESLELKSKKIEYATTKFKDIIKVYEDRILYHWKKIIRDIEIPLYIYSGKILQDYQRGRGVFLQESDSYGIKSIKFISDYNSDHDAVNYLSSGQLSGLVIALTLALNKVYGNDSINILLIDDPVQTMDEINMASFVELL
ncbi:hypothetical protein V7183_24720, partial [Bacillus sp. JJ1127]|uniref:hypothetical protein n=1 Tax=Bacillus sp. JJ1127 TaxID=3122952 RepID=UPI002FFF5864